MFNEDVIIDLAIANINRVAGPEGRKEAVVAFAEGASASDTLGQLAKRFNRIEFLRETLIKLQGDLLWAE